MELQYRPLGAVKQMLEQVGIEVTYAFEDLVFIKDNHFLLQFGKVGKMLFFYANAETDAADAQQLLAALLPLASAQGFTLIPRGRYRLSAGDDENLSLQFIEDTAPE